MENLPVLNTMPTELQVIADKLPEEKSLKIKDVISQIFAKSEEWDKQVDAIVVKDINDTMSISLADIARKNAKNYRLQIEKEFDKGREQLKSLMLDFQTEDSLLLKAKQIAQIKLKAIEEKAQFKADFVKRYEAEQKELRTKLRLEQIQKYEPSIQSFQISDLDDTVFEATLKGYKDLYEAKRAEEERLEKERIEKEIIKALHYSRRNQLLTVWEFVSEETKTSQLGELTEEEFSHLFNEIELNKSKVLEERRLTTIETERKLSIAKYIGEDSQEFNVRNLSEEEFKSLHDTLKAQFEQRVKEKEEELKKAKEEADRLESLRIEEQKKAQAEAEKLRKEKEEANKKAVETAKEMARLQEEQEAEERKKAELLKAPIVEQLNAWITGLNLPTPPLENEVTAEIMAKFNGFKKWATLEVEKFKNSQNAK